MTLIRKRRWQKSQELFETIFLCLPVKGVLCDWPRITLLCTNTVLQKKKIIWSLGIIDWHFNSTPLTFWHFLITCWLMFDSKTLSMSGTLLLFKHLPSNTQQHHQHQMTVHILKTLNLKLSFQMNQNHKNSWFPLKKRQGSKRVTSFKLSCKNQLIETLWGE